MTGSILWWSLWHSHCYPHWQRDKFECKAAALKKLLRHKQHASATCCKRTRNVNTQAAPSCPWDESPPDFHCRHSQTLSKVCELSVSRRRNGCKG